MRRRRGQEEIRTYLDSNIQEAIENPINVWDTGHSTTVEKYNQFVHPHHSQRTAIR